MSSTCHSDWTEHTDCREWLKMEETVVGSELQSFKSTTVNTGNRSWPKAIRTWVSTESFLTSAWASTGEIQPSTVWQPDSTGMLCLLHSHRQIYLFLKKKKNTLEPRTKDHHWSVSSVECVINEVISEDQSCFWGAAIHFPSVREFFYYQASVLFSLQKPSCLQIWRKLLSGNNALFVGLKVGLFRRYCNFTG